MLDSETKRRIDTARDILVGKVPDPKSQVEQITIALIYKFMDDMDAEAEELGGKRSFFVGEFEKFSWVKLMSPAMGGYDVLNLYGEAIDKMTRNEGVPQLFRDIFKNAYLPYRDPETLKLFLKTINEFNYDHSEKLGDAFEYLLSVLGSQGDAGQFRTPRHIIDFMVKVVNPQKDESILDPACGTAGFLISAYKHIVNNHTDPKGFSKPLGSKPLTPAERTKLANNIRGYDISPDMVRLSLVNLYLHGFATPNIYEYDTLTSEERWDEYADVILANPPFMSPKGGIKPHKRFSVQSNRSEVLFVDYMAEHLTPNGRAAIIVPEGIIFQSAGAYKQLRKYLIESNYLWAVVSLPAGAFNPYSGVRTSILLLDRSLAKKTDQVLFVKVEADGFDLGAQRRLIDRDDLPDALNTLRSWHKAVLDGKPDSFIPTIDSALLVSVSKLADNDDYNLSADRYREVVRIGKQKYPTVLLDELCEIVRGSSPRPKSNSRFYGGNIPRLMVADVTRDGMYVTPAIDTLTEEGAKQSRPMKKGDLVMAVSGQPGLCGILAVDACIHDGFAGFRNLDQSRIIAEYAYHYLMSQRDSNDAQSVGAVFKNLKLDQLRKFQIPLPPLEIQCQIVDEIAAHQRIIDGARQVVEGWKPNVEIDPEWSIVKLEELFEITSSKRVFESQWKDHGVPFYRAREIVLLAKNGFVDNELFISEEMFSEYASKYGTPNENDMMVTGVGTLGVCYVVRKNDRFYFKDGNILWFKKKSDIETRYIEYLFQTDFVRSQIDNTAGAVVGTYTIIRAKNTLVPLPPLEIQREIVSRIEAERQIVEGNRELIRLYEAKVKKVIEKVWES